MKQAGADSISRDCFAQGLWSPATMQNVYQQDIGL